ncbi:enoyl-CoA hydratase/isomerase family protein [bacterium]|nr:enoyl-CoA hydratase/isomerase family protein [bacterium]
MTELIRLECAAGVAEIILNRPEKRNALPSRMWELIPDLVRRAEADPDAKVVIVHGGDAGAFAAGADISEFETIYADDASSDHSAELIAAALRAIEQCAKPTLAAIEGPCVGGGVSIALACDLRIAAQGAVLGVTPARLGIVYPFDDVRRLCATVGQAAAKDILFTGRLFDAAEAYRLRLIDRLVDTGDALLAARRLAAEIGATSQWSAMANKVMIRRATEGLNAEDAAARALFVSAMRGEDFMEGRRAFLDKRSPRFTFRVGDGEAD